MKSFSIRNHPMIRLSGRFDPAQEGFPMLWSASSAEMNVRGSSLEVQIDCAYRTHKPYLSFEVDGLRAQTFAPLPGKHWYSVFLHLKPDTVHTVRILKESQAFENDPSAGCVLLKGRTDGGLDPLPPRRRKIEFIGDSLTSGEGGRGPQSFMEWVPMCFSASDNYTRFVADRLNAQYQLVSQSGWGVHCGWNNDPHCNLPRIYDQLCGPQAGQTPEENWGSGKLYDFPSSPTMWSSRWEPMTTALRSSRPLPTLSRAANSSFTTRRRTWRYSSTKPWISCATFTSGTPARGSRGSPTSGRIPSFRLPGGPWKEPLRKGFPSSSARWMGKVCPPPGREAAIIRAFGRSSTWPARWFGC